MIDPIYALDSKSRARTRVANDFLMQSRTLRILESFVRGRHVLEHVVHDWLLAEGQKHILCCTTKLTNA